MTIDGSVFKYDLATRDLLFSFKTQAVKGLILYDRDTRLLAADAHQLKLWEFNHKKDDAPELITVQQQDPLKVEDVFVNKFGTSRYHITTCKNMLEIYDDNLDINSHGKVRDDLATIQCIEFNQISMFIGTDKGKIHKFSIDTKLELGSALEVNNAPIHLLHALAQHDELFIASLSGKSLSVIDYGK